MRSQDEFFHFVTEELRASLLELDSSRKEIMQWTLLFLAILIPSLFGIVAVVRFALLPDLLSILIGLAIGLTLLSIYVLKIHEPRKTLNSEYKRKIVKKMLAFVSPDLDYHPETGISEREYMQSGLYTKDPDRYKSEDRAVGMLGRTKLEFSEIHSEYKTESTDSKGHKSETWHTIFRGVFVIADFNKDFSSKTLVLPDLCEKYFGFIGKAVQSWKPGPEELVKLEDPDFEKQFVVYSRDQIEARYLLSPSLMRKILGLREQLLPLNKGRLSISFVSSKMFIAIPVETNLFEASVWTPLWDKKTLSLYFSFLNFCVGIVEELDLNTRIWSKE